MVARKTIKKVAAHPGQASPARVAAVTIVGIGASAGGLEALELQNETLQSAHAETEAALEHFADFYEFSPVGFVTLVRDGTIEKLNLTAASFLGLERSRLVGRRFVAFVATAQRQRFDACLQRVWQGATKEGCQLDLEIEGQSPQSVQINAIRSPDGNECRMVVLDISARQRAEEMLRESSQFNAEVIANAQEGIVVYGPDLRYRVWNDYMENFTGMRASEVLGRHPLEVFPFLANSGVLANLKSVLAGGPARTAEFHFEVKLTGVSGWALDRNSPLRNASGEIIGVIGTVSDITQQRRAQDALGASFRFTRSLIDSMQDGFSVVDALGVHIDVNPALCRMTGFSREEIIGTGAPHPYWPLEEYESIQQVFGEVLSGKIRDRDLIFMRKNGERFPVMVTPAIIRNEEGKIISCTATVKDITERIRAETELKNSRERFQDIVNATDGIVWEADATSLQMTFVSKQAERLLGFPLADWRRPDFLAEHLYPEDRDWVLAYVSSCARLMKPFDLDYRFVAQDGRTVWLHDMVTVVAENGLPRWLRGITVDITHRRKAEEELVALTESLEARVIERTAELRRVSAQLSMIEERERRMLAEDLHDNLGQLLAVIKIKLTSLPDDASQSSLRQLVDLVGRADRAVRSITQQLSPPILKTLGLAPALEWLADEMSRSYGLSVHTDLGDCSRRLVDNVQSALFRSARELLINVVKHAEVKEASLTCLCNPNELILVVSDAGCGFMSVNHSAVPSHKSFGLRSVRERIVNLGGAIDIDSSPGNGTTVALYVPRRIEGKEICDDPNNACR